MRTLFFNAVFRLSKHGVTALRTHPFVKTLFAQRLTKNDDRDGYFD